jgi:hypothetical protein
VANPKYKKKSYDISVDIHADIHVEITEDKPEKPAETVLSTLISELKFSEVMQSIKSSYPKANLVDGRFTFTEKDLDKSNDLGDERRKTLYQFLADSDGFLILVRSNFDKTFGFFVPSNFQKRDNSEMTNPLLAFYWIENNSKLATSKRTDYPFYGSSWDNDIIDLWGLLEIRLNRANEDLMNLYAGHGWEINQDSFGYPVLNGKDWILTGGTDMVF